MGCYSSFHVQIPGRLESVPVPCGKCPYCLKRKVASWAFRLRKEDERSAASFFVTLTYEKPPISRIGKMTLNSSLPGGKKPSEKSPHRDLQTFFKRLRKGTFGTTWKYYAVGEYGSENWRPHYHIILFASTYRTKDELLVELYKAWTSGYIDVGTVTGASVAYVLKYVQKPSRIPEFNGDDRLSEFSLMSKGLGENFLTNATKDFYRENLEKNYVIQDGYKLAMPRFYRERILSPVEKLKQRQIIRRVSLERDVSSRRRFFLAHPLALVVDYETFKNENRLSAYRSFFKNQKIRSL